MNNSKGLESLPTVFEILCLFQMKQFCFVTPSRKARTNIFVEFKTTSLKQTKNE